MLSRLFLLLALVLWLPILALLLVPYYVCQRIMWVLSGNDLLTLKLFGLSLTNKDV